MNVYLVMATYIGYDSASFNIVEAFDSRELAESYIAEVDIYRDLENKAFSLLYRLGAEWVSANPEPRFPETRPVFNKALLGDKEYNKQHNIACQAFNARLKVFSDGEHQDWFLRKSTYMAEQDTLVESLFRDTGLHLGDCKVEPGRYSIDVLEVSRWVSKIQPTATESMGLK